MKKELRYYIPLFMGFILMLIGCMSPPIGDIPTSAIYGGGCFLVLCAAVCGMDIPGTLREIRLMRDGFVDKITEKQGE